MKEEAGSFVAQESCSIIYNDLIQEENLWGVEMCLKGSSHVGILKDGKFNALNAHIGNINTIIKSSKLFSEMEFLKDLRSIINYSLIMISNTSTAEVIKSFKAFEVCILLIFFVVVFFWKTKFFILQLKVSSNDPNFVKYKNLSIEYSINDVLEYYFKILHKTLLKVSNRDVNMVRNNDY